ncbi:anion permease [Methyloglobulus sp.]|uniref:inorganic phosphate transporter n=1 Tax=Methyloglobulus sp. TaxID=2518622 RepID=UPI00398A0841
MTIVLLFVTVCFLAFSNGANDNFKGVASLFGSGAANYRVALTWATVTTLSGSICALFLAQTLLIKFSGKGLAPDGLIQSIPFITAVAAGAGMTVILATRLGFPVSTTHALLGALTGSTLLATGTIKLAALGTSFVLPLLLSPVIAVLLAIVVYTSFRQIRQRKAIGNLLCLCVENEPAVTASHFVENSGALVSGQNRSLSIDNQAACASRYAGVILGFELQRVMDALHFFSAGAVCFARGLNDTPKIAALLLLAPGLDLQSNIVLVALTMALGGLLNARSVAETMSHKITAISHGQGLSANLTTAVLVIFASKFGLPVSTTHVSVGALFGIGLTTKQANTRMIASILLSWLLTLPCAALCAAGAYALLRTYTGVN